MNVVILQSAVRCRRGVRRRAEAQRAAVRRRGGGGGGVACAFLRGSIGQLQKSQGKALKAHAGPLGRSWLHLVAIAARQARQADLRSRLRPPKGIKLDPEILQSGPFFEPYVNILYAARSLESRPECPPFFFNGPFCAFRCRTLCMCRSCPKGADVLLIQVSDYSTDILDNPRPGTRGTNHRRRHSGGACADSVTRPLARRVDRKGARRVMAGWGAPLYE